MNDIKGKYCPLVSVVIPCYNYGKFIEEAINSVLASTYQNVEIIVVDDGPTDLFTINLLKKLRKPKTRVIFQKNQGLARARNNGIAQARGEYILPLDADDYIDPTYIEKALIILEKNHRLSLAYGYVRLFGAQDSLWKTGEYNIEKLKKENIIPSCSMFRKSAWKKVGGYESDRYQYDDWTFWLKLAAAGCYGRLIPEVLFYHRKHFDQESMTDSLRRKHEEYYQKIKDRLPHLFQKKRRNFLKHLRKGIAIAARRYVPKRILHIYFSFKLLLDPLEEWFLCTFIKKEYRDRDLNLNFFRKSVSNKERIIIFLPWLSRGGAEKVVLDLTKELDEYDIFIITTEQDNYDYVIDGEFKKITPFIYHLSSFLKRREYSRFVLNIIKHYKINILLINHCAWAYENLENIKKECDFIRTFDLLHNTANEGYKNRSKKYEKFITKTIVISNEIKQCLVQNLGFRSDRVKCILNGIDLDQTFNLEKMDKSIIQRELGIPEDKITLSFIGRLSSEKNPLKFIEIIKKFKDDSRYFFLLAGDGELRENVLSETEKYFTKKNFCYLGNYSHPEKVLAVSHLLLNTSSIEGMPLTIIEAFAMCVPVIAPNIGAIGEIVKNDYNSFLLEKNPSLDAYVESIRKTENASFYDILKSHTRESIEKEFSVKRMAKQYREVFKEI